MTRRVTIALARPVFFGGRLFSEISLQPQTREDLATLSQIDDGLEGDAALVAKLAIGVAITARMAGVSEGVIYALDGDDAESVGNAVKRLLGMAD